MKQIKNIAGYAESAWTGLYITEINDLSVAFRYGMQTGDGMQYKPVQVRNIEYDVPDWSDEDEPFFRYRGEKYYLSEFIMLDILA